MPTTYIRTLLARSHAATHRTNILISRCRQGCLAALAIPARTEPASSAQALWYARQQQDFLAWLDGGGMVREPVSVTALATDSANASISAGTIENSGVAPLFPAPGAGADEELQFSQVRMQDAVR